MTPNELDHWAATDILGFILRSGLYWASDMSHFVLDGDDFSPTNDHNHLFMVLKALRDKKIFQGWVMSQDPMYFIDAPPTKIMQDLYDALKKDTTK